MSNPLAKLWIGKCSIHHYENVTDDETFRETQELVQVVMDEPCRVSFSHDTVTQVVNTGEGVPNTLQVIKLFIRPDLEIPPGSIIEVTQHGKITKYKGSSVPAIYTNHQEITLDLYEEHA